MARILTRTIFYTNLLIFVILTQLTQGDTQPSREIVAQVTDENFEEALVDYDNALVLFYSPRCSHCKEFIPEFMMAADELIRNEPPVHSVMIDCKDGGRETCKHEDIMHLPTVKIFRRGTLVDEYDGQRTAQGMVTYLKKMVAITSEELTLSKIEGFIEGNKVAVVAILKEKGNLRENYFSLPAELSKDIRFGHVTLLPKNGDGDPTSEYGVTLYYPQHMRSKFEPWTYKYDAKNEGYDLLEFILTKRHGLVGLRTPRHVDNFAPPLAIAYFRFDINLKPKVFSYWRNRILKVATLYQNFLNFAISPIDDFRNEFTKFGLPLPPEDKMDRPLIFVILRDNSKYLMETDFSIENLTEFLAKIADDSAEPFLKSQPIPEEHPGLIQNIVAKNFKSVVLRREKDVLLELYAPWCSVCREVEGVLEQLAEMLSGEDFVILRMDATENEVPRNFDVPRFPTFYYIPKSPENAEPVLFDDPPGPVTFGNLLNFIREHATFDSYRIKNDEL